VISAQAQIDPTRRELIQMGYNQPLEGSGPLAVYAFYYLNSPQAFHNTNLTMRLAVAPVYLDSEFGFSHLLGPHTDVGIGAAGGGFADSYSELRQGKFHRDESFTGHGGEISSSIYHLFNPVSQIPLYGVIRGAMHYSSYVADDETAGDFHLPDDQLFFRVRAGLRWGGREPVMLPDLAMEMSIWYEGEFRTDPNAYGFSGDRDLNASSHLFWGRALLTYTMPQLKHSFAVNLTAGTGTDLDRFSAYRLGGNLPLAAEFPLSLPGYYYQELSAQSFVLVGGSYNIPLDAKRRWQMALTASSAYVNYLDGLEQPGHWNSGAGGGIIYRSPTDSWQIALAYAYGFDAIRKDDRGAQSVSILLQFDLDRTRRRFFDPTENLNRSRGLQGIMNNIFR
jgi:hypothetical protein